MRVWSILGVMMDRLLAFAALALLGAGTGAAQTPAEAFKLGCGSCHPSESRVLRAIPDRDDLRRRAFIQQFMAQHPCERDDLKPLIVDYLLARTKS
ncbi:MAG: hypothetical protein IT536_09760 [Hyphomicrobiales bacterium]|nr:hypothetical protein [Hyphomicrobiales bacterium]